MAAISAGRSHVQTQAKRPGRIVVLDGARTLGAKILVAGGGRCNVTHHAVDETAYAGSTRPAIRKVLRRFDVPQTIAFFRELGVTLKREPTGKLFPTTDRARTVLDALLRECDRLGIEIRYPRRVEQVQRDGERFIVSGAWGTLSARSLILATGGKSLPKSGSDGHGYTLAKSLGHTVTPRIFPSLVPLVLAADHPLRSLAGISHHATLELRSGTGRRLCAFTNDMLCTHFGLSGPAVLDISRYLLDAQRDDPSAMLHINWLPQETADSVERHIMHSGGSTVLQLYRDNLPERLWRTLLEHAGVEPARRASQLTKAERKALVETLTAMPVPVTGDRGFTYAEVTAGGVPLGEVQLKSMESRCCSNLFLCGEILDVDGRIGGFNFQWAWASGFIAGTSALGAVSTS